MKDIKQIREQYDIVTDKSTSEEDKFASLVESGLFEESKLPLLKRAFSKSPEDMTVAERRAVVQLAESLMAQNSLISESINVKRDYLTKFDDRQQKQFSEKDMPYIIILKRKGVRYFGDNQKVGMYYSQAIDRYVSIPFVGNKGGHFGPGIGTSVMAEESDVLLERNTKKKLFSYSQDDADTEKLRQTPISQMDQATRKIVRKNVVKDVLDGRMKAPEAIGFALRSLLTKKKAKAPEADAPEASGKREIEPDTKALLDAMKSKAAATRAAKMAKDAKIPAWKKANPEDKPSMAAQQRRGGKAPSFADIPDIKAAATKANNDNADKFAKAIEARRQKATAVFNKKVQDSRASEAGQLNEYSKTEAALDAVSLVPGIGNVVSAGQAIYKAAKGDYVGAAIDAAGAVPVVGNMGKGAKMATKAVGAVAKGAQVANMAGKAAKAVGVAGKAGKVAQIAGKAARAYKGIKAAVGTATDAMSSSSKPEEPKKFVEPKGEFNLKANLDNPLSHAKERSAPTTPEAIKRRDDTLYRKSLQKESAIIDRLKEISEQKLNEATLEVAGQEVTINSVIAGKILNVYESVNRTNKKKMTKMLNESVDSFKNILSFAVRQ